jgi:hypothetical protein
MRGRTIDHHHFNAGTSTVKGTFNGAAHLAVAGHVFDRAIDLECAPTFACDDLGKDR